MLHRLLSLFQQKGRRVLGFRLSRELDDCAKDIMAVFGIADFYRDYEDTWEWFENSRKARLHVNISRPHNRKTGDYNVPVLVRVSGPASRLTDELLHGYAQQIANRLGTEIWVGAPICRIKNDSRYEFDVWNSFLPSPS